MVCMVSEMQRKLEMEAGQRKMVEERLLSVEKEKSGMAVDLQQLRSQAQSLTLDLQHETEKVGGYHCYLHCNVLCKLNDLCIGFYFLCVN